MQPFYKCVKSDDPALKAHAAAGPSTSTLSGAAAHMQ